MKIGEVCDIHQHLPDMSYTCRSGICMDKFWWGEKYFHFVLVLQYSVWHSAVYVRGCVVWHWDVPDVSFSLGSLLHPHLVFLFSLSNKHYLTAQIGTYVVLKNKQPESHIFHCWHLIHKSGKATYIAERNVFGVKVRNSVLDAEFYWVYETWSVCNQISKLVSLANRIKCSV